LGFEDSNVAYKTEQAQDWVMDNRKVLDFEE